MKYPNSIGIVADLHCGSKWGLMPPKWSAPHEPSHTVHPGAGQRYMWQWWMQTAKRWREIIGGSDLDLLVVNGDVIDGKQPKSRATGLITADLHEQADIAAHTLAPFCDVLRPQKRVRSTGTDYHEGPDCPLPGLDEKLGLTCKDEFIVKLPNGGALQVQHDPGASGAIYRGTVLDREILWSIIAGALGKVPQTTILVRSHWHYFHEMRTHGKTFILTPGWQLQTRYARKKNRFRWTPDLGGVLLTRNDGAYCGYDTHVDNIPLPSGERRVVSYDSL